MNEVIKNTHAFVDILSMARGEAVQTWDEETFQRAFKWAVYYEEVYSKLKSKPALAEKLNKYIDKFNKTGKVNLGFLHLSFNKLEHSKDILRNCLLQNPHISNPQFENILRLYKVKLGSCNDTRTLKVLEQDISQLMNQKGILAILSMIREKFTENVEDKLCGVSNVSDSCDKEMESFTHGYQDAGCIEGHTLKNLALNSAGQLLFQHILHFLESNENKDSGTMHEKLGIISLQEDGLELITSCLLFIPEDCQSHSKADSIQQFVVNWLSDSLSGKQDHPFWNLPLTMLCRIAFKYYSILELYLSRLTSWTNSMYPVLTCQMSLKERRLVPIKDKIYVWRSQKEFSSLSTTNFLKDNGRPLDEECADSLDSLFLHFKCLTTGPAHIKKLCYKRIELFISGDVCNISTNAEVFVQKEHQFGGNVWWELYCRIKSEK